MNTRKFLLPLAVALPVLLTAAMALAHGDGFDSPKPDQYALNGWQALYSLVFVAAICVVGFKSAKRTQVA